MKKVKLKIDKLMGELTQKQFEKLTGVPQSVISTMVRNNKERVDLNHIEKIINALDINDMNEIFEIVNDKEDPTK